MRYLSLLVVLCAGLMLCSSASAQTATCPSGVLHCANLTWNAPTAGGAPTGYNVYRSSVTGGCANVTAASCTKAGSAVATAPSFVDSPLSQSTKYFWVVTAFNASGESGPSNEVTATTTPDPAPAAPAGLTVTVK